MRTGPRSKLFAIAYRQGRSQNLEKVDDKSPFRAQVVQMCQGLKLFPLIEYIECFFNLTCVYFCRVSAQSELPDFLSLSVKLFRLSLALSLSLTFSLDCAHSASSIKAVTLHYITKSLWILDLDRF